MGLASAAPPDLGCQLQELLPSRPSKLRIPDEMQAGATWVARYSASRKCIPY